MNITENSINNTQNYTLPTTFVPMSAVDKRTGIIANPEVVPYSKVAKGYTYFEENDVLFAKITPCMQNGKHVIARNLIDRIGFGTTEFHVLRAKDGIIPEWIWYFIRQSYFLKEATAYFTGAVGQQRVPDTFLKDYFIPLPSLDEQKRIITKLTELMQNIEHARVACENQLEAANTLPSAYLREVFESEEAKKWERRKLGEVVKFSQSGVWGDEPDGALSEELFPVLRSTEIGHKGYINLDSKAIAIRRIKKEIAEKYYLIPNDLLIVRSGGTTGKIILGRLGIFNGESKKYLFSNFLLRIQLNENLADTEFLWFYLNWDKFLEDNIPRLMRRTTGIQNLPMDEYFAIAIPVPPLFEQKHIAAELKEKMSEAENLQSTIRNQQSALDALPQVILRKAFRGEL